MRNALRLPAPTPRTIETDTVTIIEWFCDFDEDLQFTLYQGTENDLISAGLVPAAAFPAVGKSGVKTLYLTHSDGSEERTTLTRRARGLWRIGRYSRAGKPLYVSSLACCTSENGRTSEDEEKAQQRRKDLAAELRFQDCDYHAEASAAERGHIGSKVYLDGNQMRTIYEGRAQQLISCGLATVSMLPNKSRSKRGDGWRVQRETGQKETWVVEYTHEIWRLPAEILAQIEHEQAREERAVLDRVRGYLRWIERQDGAQ